ncbi:MAG: YbaY family lipoprotein [Alphaproteobacteria bacterium]
MAAVILSGEVRLPSPTDLSAGALLLVRLVSAPYADAPGKTLAETERMVSGACVTALSFALRVRPDDLPSAGLLFEAELRRGGGSRLRPGDFLSTRSVAWSPAAGTRAITILLEPVS